MRWRKRATRRQAEASLRQTQDLLEQAIAPSLEGRVQAITFMLVLAVATMALLIDCIRDWIRASAMRGGRSTMAEIAAQLQTSRDV